MLPPHSCRARPHHRHHRNQQNVARQSLRVMSVFCGDSCVQQATLIPLYPSHPHVHIRIHVCVIASHNTLHYPGLGASILAKSFLTPAHRPPVSSAAPARIRHRPSIIPYAVCRNPKQCVPPHPSSHATASLMSCTPTSSSSQESTKCSPAITSSHRWVLGLANGPLPPFAACGTCGRRPKTCAVGFWAPKSLQGRVWRISKPAASGRRRAPLGSGPRKRSVAAFCGLRHLRQASENVRRWILGPEIAAGPRLANFQARGKRSKTCAVGFWASQTVRCRLLRLAALAAGVRKRAPLDSGPRNRCRAAFGEFPSPRQAVEDVRRWVLGLANGPLPPFAACGTCGRRPKTCAVGFWAPKSLQGRVWRISKPAASGRRRAPLGSGPRKRSVAAFCGLRHLRQASENVRRWILGPEIAAGPRLANFQARGKRSKTCAVGFWASQTVRCRLLRLAALAAGVRKRAPLDSGPRNRCRAAFGEFPSPRQAVEDVRRWVLGLANGPLPPFAACGTCGRRPKTCAVGFWAPKSLQGRVWRISKPAASGRRRAPLGSGPRKRSVAAFCGLRHLRQASENVRRWILGPEIAAGPRLANFQARGKRSKTCAVGFWASQTVRCRLLRLAALAAGVRKRAPLDSGPRNRCRAAFGEFPSPRQAVEDVRRWVLGLANGPLPPFAACGTCGRRPKTCAVGFWAPKSLQGRVWRISKPAASGRRRAPLGSGPRKRSVAAFCGLRHLRQASENVRRWILGPEIAAGPRLANFQARGKRSKTCAVGFWASQTVRCRLLRLAALAAGVRKRAPLDSGPRNRCRAAFGEFPSPRQAVEDVRRWVLGLANGPLPPFAACGTCGRRPKTCAVGFWAPKSLQGRVWRISKPAASGRRRAPLGSGPRKRSVAAFCGLRHLRQASENVRRWILGPEIAAGPRLANFQARGKRSKTCAVGFWASQTVRCRLLRLAALAAGVRKRAPLDSGPRNRCRAAFGEFPSPRQAVEDVRRWVLGLANGPLPPFAACGTCGRRPKTCAVGFWAPKSLQGRVWRISKPAASGRRRAPLGSGPRKRSVAAFCGLRHLRQASENVRRWILGPEIAAGPRLANFQARGKRSKTCAVGFWASQTVRCRLLRLAALAAGVRKRAPLDSGPRNRCRAAFGEFPSPRQAVEDVRRWVLGLANGPLPPFAACGTCGRRPKTCAVGFWAPKSLQGRVWRISKPAASGRRRAPLGSGPRKRSVAAFCGLRHLRQASENVRRWILGPEIAAGPRLANFQARGKRSKTCAVGFWASQTVRCRLLRLAALAAGVRKRAPLDSGPRNRCRAAFGEFPSPRQAVEDVRRWVLGLANGPLPPFAACGTCGRRPKTCAVGFWAPKSLQGRVWRISKPAASGRRRAPLGSGPRKRSVAAFCGLRHLRQASENVRRWILGPEIAAGPRLANFQARGKRSKTCAVGFWASQTVRCRLLRLAALAAGVRKRAPLDSGPRNRCRAAFGEIF